MTVKINASMDGTGRFAGLLHERYEFIERLFPGFSSLTQGAPVCVNKHPIDRLRGLP